MRAAWSVFSSSVLVRTLTRLPYEGNGDQEIDAGDNDNGVSPADPADEPMNPSASARATFRADRSWSR